ncbi:mannose-1-phosphate guanyltransferase [Rhodospirillum rubrum]|uniref:ABC transporter permease n=1 Tax=Rhodospirillum rubrum TaxID=1085 RepID=UPI001904C655|nr:ABC transporter permease [Rhodospirillum rubrum]MBK1665180.1 mannose-1-phosphate guanyltransferase [Rhodospirillum rubrum]MBK1677802.1 mannose-1-phosphate guanyltransferase [Rhodospirillum rubrum]
MSRYFSFSRMAAIFFKELIQMRRDRLTFGMMLSVPMLQLILFGFAINTDPKHLATVLNIQSPSAFSRDLTAAMSNSGYFDIIGEVSSEAEIDRLLDMGEVQFVLTIPPEFSSELQKGNRPVVLMEVDATDPAATSNALHVIGQLARTAFDRHLVGPLAPLKVGEDPIDLRIHSRYNPEANSQYNVVPGLMGVILTMTMVMMTSLAITRERERGTMETLLSMPVRPLEVMIGKILPYIGLGYIQIIVVLIAARLLFDVPVVGSLGLLALLLLLFIAANLAIGLTFSALSANQFQAMQMSFFYFLPALLLSGFMFPFRGMPVWAQVLGEILPLTHFLRVVRGILLKGNGFWQVWPELWPQALFTLVAFAIALKVFRKTLD